MSSLTNGMQGVLTQIKKSAENFAAVENQLTEAAACPASLTRVR
jgi:hypothetical protein